MNEPTDLDARIKALGVPRRELAAVLEMAPQTLSRQVHGRDGMRARGPLLMLVLALEWLPPDQRSQFLKAARDQVQGLVGGEAQVQETPKAVPVVDELKLTPKLRELLERVEKQSGLLLEIQVLAAGGGAAARLNKLRSADLVAMTDHPTVEDRTWGGMARAIAITDAGRARLREGTK